MFNHLIDPSFKEINRLFVLLSQNGIIEKQTQDIIFQKQKQRYNVMIDGKNFIDQSVKDGLRTYENNRKVATGHRDDYKNCCLLDYNNSKEHYKLITIDERGESESNFFVILKSE